MCRFDENARLAACTAQHSFPMLNCQLSHCPSLSLTPFLDPVIPQARNQCLGRWGFALCALLGTGQFTSASAASVMLACLSGIRLAVSG